jgi:DNA polymerase (family 10)
MLDNRFIADLLRRVAAVYQVTDDSIFRYRAYENAATAIESLDIPLETFWQQNRLNEIPSLGPNIISHLSELFATGKVKHFQTEIDKVPAGMFALLKIRGVGPKTAYKISRHFKLNDEKTALNDLKRIIDKRQLLNVPGIKSSFEEKIKTALISHDTSSQRYLLIDALDIALPFVDYLKKSSHISQAEPLGSIRRRLETVGDIDIGFASDKPSLAMSDALKYEKIESIVSQGNAVARIKLKSGNFIDLKNVETKQWGSLLQHYTGSKLHNISLRNFAKDKGMSLSEYGIKHKNGKIYTFSDEISFYAHLGLSFIPPELREDRGEIQLSASQSLPQLLEQSDIKGDLHLHSNFEFPSSHDLGQSSLSDYFKVAIKLDYHYLGFADHNPKYSDLTFRQKKQILSDRKNKLIEQYINLKKLFKHRTIKLLIGLEIDIRRDGNLALEPELIDDLDYAIASIHSSFDLSQVENTQRIINALSCHPKVKILGHPTNRLLNRRQPIAADWSAIFQFCANNNKYLELNSTPVRLDLPDDLIREATGAGAKIVINTDSHHHQQMDFINFGVWTARRGWVEKQHCLNTLNHKDLHQVLK